MKKIIYLVVCLILFFIFHNKFLFAEESMLTIKQQLDRLQREVNDLSKSVFKNPNQSNENFNDNKDNQTINFAAIDMRIYDLEKDLKNLTMNLEEQVFLLDEIIDRIDKIEEDFDAKLQNINDKNPKENIDNKNNKEDVIIENSKENLDNKNNKEDVNIENSENTLGTLIITSENNMSTSNKNNKSEETNQNQINSNLTNLSPENQFQIAFDQIRNKNYYEAKLSLKSFIKQNSGNQLSGSAHYWLAKLYLLEKNYREAVLTFVEGYEKYPNSIKAPNMLYETADALLEMGKNKEACVTLTTLSKDFSSHKLKNKSEKKKLEISCDVVSE